MTLLAPAPRASLSRLEHLFRVLFFPFTLVSVAFFVVRFWQVYAAGELFHRLGFDWSLFYAQAMAMRSGAGSRMYDIEEINRQVQTLMRYYGGPATSLGALPVPYPPWFAAAIVPFTLPPAPIGFALWLGASVAAAVFLAYRVKQFLPGLGWPGAAAAILSTIPVAWGMWMGQPAVLLAIAVGEMLVSFKAHRDFRAGLWLAVLVFKPQYALLFGLLILWKRRWAALAGAAVLSPILVLVGVLAAGVPSLPRFVAVLGEMSDLRNPVAGPVGMINWRAIVLAVRPGVDEQLGVLLVGVLSLVTMLGCLLLWRGRWDPDDPSFAPRFCVLTLGALITSYHSHIHGAALLIVPLAAAWATPIFQPATRFALLVAIYTPTVMVLWFAGIVGRLAISSDPNIPLWIVWPDSLPPILFFVAFALMYADVWAARTPLPWLLATVPRRVRSA